MYTFKYVIEQQLPNGCWQKVTGIVSADSPSEARSILIRQNVNRIRIISLIKK
jgi:squalene cyclase